MSTMDVMPPMPPNEVFTQLLQHIFRNPNEDIQTRHPSDSHNPVLMPLKHRILASFNTDCVKLIDKNGLSILGYIFLTNKYFALMNLYYKIKDNNELCEHIARSLNAELKFVLTHRVDLIIPERQYLKEFITCLTYVKDSFPKFQLDVENAKLLGYRLAKVELNKVFTFPDDIPLFNVPEAFVPHIPPPPGQQRVYPLPPGLPPGQQYPPPPGLPPGQQRVYPLPPTTYPGQQYAPPPPPGQQYPPPTGPYPGQQYPPPTGPYPGQQYPPPTGPYPGQQYPPPPYPGNPSSYRSGGTRKNHKRHKKQNAKKRFTKKHNK